LFFGVGGWVEGEGYRCERVSGQQQNEEAKNAPKLELVSTLRSLAQDKLTFLSFLTNAKNISDEIRELLIEFPNGFN
jgi:hypothetical protein